MTYPKLELDGHEFEELLAQVSERLAGFIDGLPAAPAHAVGRAAGAVDLAAPGEKPGELSDLLDHVFTAAALAIETAGPGFFGYIPGGGAVSSAVGELISRTLNRYTALADFAPALVALEDGLLRWLTTLFGLPPGSGGLLTTGGSQAVLSMVLAARQRYLGEELARGRIYLSDQANHCIHKAARIAGFPARSLRVVPTSRGRHLDPDAVAAAIAEDRAAGLTPFLLFGSAGTTNTGAVDPLADLAAVAARHHLWFHVDGCYGGFFQLTERGRTRLAGIEHADSVSLDPHKSLFLPYGTGTLLVRDLTTLAAAHTDDDPGEYLQDLAERPLPNYAHLGTELSREYRGLRLWLPLHLHGLAAFRDALDEKLDLALRAHHALRAEPALLIAHPPELSTVAFRLRDGDDQANRALLDRINATGQTFLSSTRLDGRLTLRICILSHRTHAEHLDQALDIIRDALPRC